MTFLSANEDFVRRTLASVSGDWSKLQYVASLRLHNGVYQHWGLARIYGEEASSRAIADAHRDLFLALLRTPVKELWKDAQEAARRSQTTDLKFVARLDAAREELVPEQYGGGSIRHFNSVLVALSGLARRGATRRGS